MKARLVHTLLKCVASELDNILLTNTLCLDRATPPHLQGGVKIRRKSMACCGEK